ncbi:MAG: hypothetical protein AUJ12_09350 [Alphaproteobacteria bacterium CG1_02_46_17]|nr:MAG: hypothetical protein AUJ12_09350 [Alphaproteobacteria bacterium CG1_02_46_17]
MTYYRQKLLVLVCFFIVLGSFPQSSDAFFGLNDSPPLSYDMETPLAKLDKGMEVKEETPSGEESLAMQISLPNGWIRAEFEQEQTLPKAGNGAFEKQRIEQEDGDIFRLLVRYSTPPRLQRRSEFRVRSIEINSLISLDNWFVEYLLQMGFSPEGVNKVSTNRLEAQYTLFEYGEPMVTRAVVERSGNKIILAEYLVHQENYQVEKDQQIRSIQKFKLLAPDASLPVALNTYSFVDIAKFDYPQNWILYSPGIITIERMEASVINIKGMNTDDRKILSNMQLNGRIDVTVVSRFAKTTVQNEMSIIGQALKDKDLQLSDKMDSVPLPQLNEKVENANIAVYHIIPPESELLKINKFSRVVGVQQKLADYEYWIGTLETSGRYYFIRLLTIGRDEDFKSWAENTEVFYVLLGSVAPVNDEIH